MGQKWQADFSITQINLVIYKIYDCTRSTHLEGVHDGAEAVEHDVSVVGDLLLEGVQDAVDEQLLQPRVNVRRAKLRHHLRHIAKQSPRKELHNFGHRTGVHE